MRTHKTPMVKRIVSLTLLIALFTGCVAAPADTIASKKKVKLSTKDISYYTTSVNWGLSFRKAHKKPSGSVPYAGFKLKKFDTEYVHHPKKKEIYLTFDCGYENGHTKKVLDILKKKNIKAIFFITKPFLLEKPKLVKRMKKEGHLVGSHTCTHPYLSKCKKARIKSELRQLEKLMKKKTGYELDKYLRPPYGNYSIKSLNVAKKLGYTTVLWSLAWNDYDAAHQPSVDYVINQFKKRYHKGMIPLLHIISSADTKALPGIIKFMKKKGYTFHTFGDDTDDVTTD